ncbi:MAG: hypothetical protein HC901_00425 [Bdellovibrionaceae bacterium]|nr:hypothetical protein [Pseudobdellovibrionaceae bacterium]
MAKGRKRSCRYQPAKHNSLLVISTSSGFQGMNMNSGITAPFKQFVSALLPMAAFLMACGEKPLPQSSTSGANHRRIEMGSKAAGLQELQVPSEVAQLPMASPTSSANERI